MNGCIVSRPDCLVKRVLIPSEILLSSCEGLKSSPRKFGKGRRVSAIAAMRDLARTHLP
jgi:hypothetical protein